MSSPVGASRHESSSFFFEDIAHYLYAGDTALHMAAAAFRRHVAELLSRKRTPEAQIRSFIDRFEVTAGVAEAAWRLARVVPGPRRQAPGAVVF
jgi:hypothetical protein